MHPLQSSAWLLSLLLAPSSLAMLNCKSMVIDDHKFNLEKLGGPHSVVTSRYQSSTDSHYNTTYTVDICKNLKKSGKEDKKKQCPNYTRACAIMHHIEDDQDTVEDWVAIAGGLQDSGGSAFEYDLTRLKTSDSHSDNEKEGLRLVMKGGKKPLNGPVKERRAQKAVIEFLCDPDKTGTEGEWDSEDKYEDTTRRRRADGDDKEGDDDGDKKGDDEGDKDGDKGGEDGGDEGESSVEHQLVSDGAALIWNGYGAENDVDVLRMTWYTKYACEKRDDSDDSDDGNSSSHWGFFTWFIIVVFLGTASYLIFGSWLNYNRYGARGWDLVPHGDTIRDIPYLLKDWLRRVLNTVQGAGSRGGYSAV